MFSLFRLSHRWQTLGTVERSRTNTWKKYICIKLCGIKQKAKYKINTLESCWFLCHLKISPGFFCIIPKCNVTSFDGMEYFRSNAPFSEFYLLDMSTVHLQYQQKCRNIFLSHLYTLKSIGTQFRKKSSVFSSKLYVCLYIGQSIPEIIHCTATTLFLDFVSFCWGLLKATFLFHVLLLWTISLVCVW